MSKPITHDVSHAYQALVAFVGETQAHLVYELIKAVIVEQALPDESDPPEVWSADLPESVITNDALRKLGDG